MNAMIFAAGLGTRLKPLTNDRPKALVEVDGKTLLEHNIVKLKDVGFDHIIVNVHHFGEQIIGFLHDHDNFGIDIRISDERQKLLDTGGGLKHAIPLFNERGPILVHNVDIISDIDLNELYSQHVSNVGANHSNVLCATLAIHKRTTSRYLMFDAQKNVCGWTNIKTGAVKGLMGEKYAYAGIQVIDPNLFPYLWAKEEDAFPIMDFYLDICHRVALAGADITGKAWVDCGKPEALEIATRLLNDEGQTTVK